MRTAIATFTNEAWRRISKEIESKLHPLVHPWPFLVDISNADLHTIEGDLVRTHFEISGQYTQSGDPYIVELQCDDFFIDWEY